MYEYINQMLEAGDREGAYMAICEEFARGSREYELYILLAFYYLPVNANQAYICMQQARFYAQQAGADTKEIDDTINVLKSEWGCKKTSLKEKSLRP